MTSGNVLLFTMMSLQEQFSHDRAWRNGPGISDGSDIEIAILGKPSIPQNERIAYYMPYSAAIEYVRKYPPSPLGRSAIIKTLQGYVKSFVTNVAEPVKFFTAVGTPIDTYHGVDAIFSQGDAVATLDISMREKSVFKDDALLVVSFDNGGKPVASVAELETAARTIAETISRRHQMRAVSRKY